ncbi:ribonuclease H-like domain-containing protein [Tanacetum coccineum]
MVTHFRVGSNKATKHFTLNVSILFVLLKSYRNAYRDVFNALIKNNTWTLVLRPKYANIVRFMWLFKHKYLADCMRSCYKARLVVNDSTELPVVDVDETFSTVVKPTTIQTVISLVVSWYWHVYQLDRSLDGLKHALQCWFHRFAA